MSTAAKRSCDDDGDPDEEDSKMAKVDSEEAFLSGMTIHLHPAALGKTRRNIFEKQITKRGGTLVESYDCKVDAPPFLILIENAAVGGDKVRPIVEKCVEAADRWKNKDVEIVSTSWLSKCLEEGRRVDTDAFRLDKKVLAKKAKRDEEEAKKTSSKDEDEEATTASTTTSYIDRNKHKFVCAQSSDNPTSSNLNKHITDQLEKLAAAYKSSNDTWRAFGYQKAISAIKNYPKAITSRQEAAKIPNVGAKMAEKIIEIVEDGSLRKVAEVCDSEKMKVLDLFTRVWGAGASTAEQWYQKGFRTLKDLEEKAILTKHQKIGLKHFDDLDERMERAECTEILEVVREAALELQPGLEVIACGSYRRGKSTCGDLDILITHESDSALDGLFEKLLGHLHKSGFLTDDLTVQRDGRQQKYLGVCKLLDKKHRRLDIIVVPWDERACAIMYFTGSAHFNRSMRLLATKMGMSLSEHALVTNIVRGQHREKMNEGSVLPTPTEESVFEHLGLPYRAPHERNH